MLKAQDTTTLDDPVYRHDWVNRRLAPEEGIDAVIMDEHRLDALVMPSTSPVVVH